MGLYRTTAEDQQRDFVEAFHALNDADQSKFTADVIITFIEDGVLDQQIKHLAKACFDRNDVLAGKAPGTSWGKTYKPTKVEVEGDEAPVKKRRVVRRKPASGTDTAGSTGEPKRRWRRQQAADEAPFTVPKNAPKLTVLKGKHKGDIPGYDPKSYEWIEYDNGLIYRKADIVKHVVTIDAMHDLHDDGFQMNVYKNPLYIIGMGAKSIKVARTGPNPEPPFYLPRRIIANWLAGDAP